MKTNNIGSIFRYPGGKSKSNIRKKILSRFPKKYREFRDCFVGGGGVFFGINPHSVDCRWINDINKPLISVYEAVRDRLDEFLTLCRTIEPPIEGEPTTNPRLNSRGGKEYNKRLKEVFDFLKYNNNCDQALRYFFINRTVWGGRVNYNPNMESRLYFSNPSGWNIIKTNKISIASDYLQNTKITSVDFSEVIKEDGTDVLIYADPPYMRDTELASQSKLYECGFEKNDHIRLRDCVLNSKHKIVISYDDHDEIRELYSDKIFCIYEEEWTYCGTSSPKNSVSQKNKTKGKELIITNFYDC